MTDLTRANPRMALEARIEIEADDKVRLLAQLAALSMDGLFLKTEASRPIGTELELVLVARKEGLRAAVRAVIVHVVTPAEASATLPAGLGLVFTAAAPDAIATLEGLTAAS